MAPTESGSRNKRYHFGARESRKSAISIAAKPSASITEPVVEGTSKGNHPSNACNAASRNDTVGARPTATVAKKGISPAKMSQIATLWIFRRLRRSLFGSVLLSILWLRSLGAIGSNFPVVGLYGQKFPLTHYRLGASFQNVFASGKMIDCKAGNTIDIGAIN